MSTTGSGFLIAYVDFSQGVPVLRRDWLEAKKRMDFGDSSLFFKVGSHG